MSFGRSSGQYHFSVEETAHLSDRSTKGGGEGTTPRLLVHGYGDPGVSGTYSPDGVDVEWVGKLECYLLCPPFPSPVSGPV